MSYKVGLDLEAEHESLREGVAAAIRAQVQVHRRVSTKILVPWKAEKVPRLSGGGYRE